MFQEKLRMDLTSTDDNPKILSQLSRELMDYSIQ